MRASYQYNATISLAVVFVAITREALIGRITPVPTLEKSTVVPLTSFNETFPPVPT
jgi:hypothetical protein